MRHDRCVLLKKILLMCQKVGWQGAERVRQAVFLLKWFSRNDSAPHRSLSTTIGASRVTYLPFSFPFNHHRVPDGLPLRQVVRKPDHMEHLGRENVPCGAEIGPHGAPRQGKRARWCGNRTTWSTWAGKTRHVVRKSDHLEHLGRENVLCRAGKRPPCTSREMTGMRCLGGCQNLNDSPPVRVKNQRSAFSEDETTPTSLPAGKVTVSVWPI